jgi:hypothetical protein
MRLETQDGDKKQNYHKIFICEGFNLCKTPVQMCISERYEKPLDKLDIVTRFSSKHVFVGLDDPSKLNFINFVKKEPNHKACETELIRLLTFMVFDRDCTEYFDDPIPNLLDGSIIVEERHKFNGKRERGFSVSYGLSTFGKSQDGGNSSLKVDASKFEVCRHIVLLYCSFI